MSSHSPVRALFRRLLWPALLALALVLVLGPARSAEAANYRNHITRVPETPTSAQSVRVWMGSDTVSGETAGLEALINGVYTKYLGATDTSGPSPANWRVDIPAQPNGTTVQYQLFTRNQSGSDYGFTGFNWSYTVNDGDVQWDGLKHDTFDSYYRNPFGAVPADQDVTLRFRTIPLDVTGVDLRVYSYDPATGNTSGPLDYAMTYLQDRVENSINYAIWTYTLDTPNSPAILYYKFEVTDGLDVDYYGDDHGGAHDNLNQGGTGMTADNEPFEAFQR